VTSSILQFTIFVLHFCVDRHVELHGLLYFDVMRPVVLEITLFNPSTYLNRNF